MSFLDGDGRFSLSPPAEARGRPLTMRRSNARLIVQAFEDQKGRPWCSSSGGTLWVIERYLTEAGRTYRVDPDEYGGWVLTVTEEVKNDPRSSPAA